MEKRIAEASRLLEEIADVEHIFITEKERKAYEQRVVTITKQWWQLASISWMITPREIARYGWTLSDPTTLECTQCKVKLHLGETIQVDENSKAHIPTSRILTSIFSEVNSCTKSKFLVTLKETHKAACKWALSEIPPRFANIYAIPSIISQYSPLYGRSSPAALYCFSQNLDTFEYCPEDFIPALSKTLAPVLCNEWNALSKQNTEIHEIFTVIQQKILEFTSVNASRDSCLLALCGWKACDMNASQDSRVLSKRTNRESLFILRCDWCHRDVGAWNFQVNATSPSPSPKRTKLLTAAAGSAPRGEFDGLVQHRSFCPWAQHSQDELPAWKQVLKYLQQQSNETPISSFTPELGFKAINFALACSAPSAVVL